MSAAAGGRTPEARSSVIRATLWSTGWWTLLATIADVGLALLLGSLAWWLGWTRPPIKDFFVTMAGLGGALLIAYSVTVSQVAPVLVRNTGAKLTPGRLGSMFGATLGIAASAIVGIGASLALVRNPIAHPQWVWIALFGVSVVTLAALALTIGLGTAVYVFLFFEE